MHSIHSGKVTIVSEMHQLSCQLSDVLVVVVLSIYFDSYVTSERFLGVHLP